MSFWKETGRRHGLTTDSGFLLGGDAPGIADIMRATLWSTVIDRFDIIEAMLEETAPTTFAVKRRVAELPQLAKLAENARENMATPIAAGRSKPLFARRSKPE
jgi:glutathione S-transferase